MRALWIAASGLLVCACSVPLTGAPCETDSNCPSGQFCAASKLCEEGSAPAPGPDAGPACVSDPACADGTAAKACDPAGGETIGTCVEVSPGCRKVRDLAACPTGQACSGGACRCQQGCSAGETKCIDQGTLGTCAVPEGQVCGKFAESACTGGLVCGASGAGSGCVCPAPSPTGVVFVDPTVTAIGAEATGAEEPAGCRFRRLTDALAGAASGTVVKLTGPDPLPAQTVLDQETFPLAIPAGVQVFAQGCTSGACNPEAWVVVLGSAAAGAAAVTLGADSAVYGLTFRYAGATAAAFLSCDQGSAILQDVALLGSDDGTAKAATGVAVGGTCDAVLRRFSASFFTGAAVSVDGAGADLTISGGSYSASGVGLALVRGSATVSPVDSTIDATRPSFSSNAVGIAVGKAGVAEAATLGALKPVLSKNGTGLSLATSAAEATVDQPSVTQSTGRSIEAKGGLLTLSGGTVSGGTVGILVDGADATVSTGTVVTLSSGAGVEVLATPSGVTLDGVRVTANRGAGVKLVSGSLALYSSEIDAQTEDGALILGGAMETSGTSFHDNGAWGLSIANAAVNVYDADVYGNGTSAAGGGLGVVGVGASFGGFTGNKLHGNYRAQVYFGAAPASGSAWKISSFACGPTTNRLYCYPSGAYGLVVDATLSAVEANKVSWAHDAPATATFDYQGPVTAGGPCTKTDCP